MPPSVLLHRIRRKCFSKTPLTADELAAVLSWLDQSRNSDERVQACEAVLRFDLDENRKARALVVTEEECETALAQGKISLELILLLLRVPIELLSTDGTLRKVAKSAFTSTLLGRRVNSLLVFERLAFDGDEEARLFLHRALSDSHEMVRTAAASSLERIRTGKSSLYYKGQSPAT
jgi:hypothetical protein